MAMLRLMKTFTQDIERKYSEHFSINEQCGESICMEKVDGRQGKCKSMP